MYAFVCVCARETACEGVYGGECTDGGCVCMCVCQEEARVSKVGVLGFWGAGMPHVLQQPPAQIQLKHQEAEC